MAAGIGAAAIAAASALGTVLAQNSAKQSQEQAQQAGAEAQLNNAIGKIGGQQPTVPAPLEALLAQIQQGDV